VSLPSSGSPQAAHGGSTEHDVNRTAIYFVVATAAGRSCESVGRYKVQATALASAADVPNQSHELISADLFVVPIVAFFGCSGVHESVGVDAAIGLSKLVMPPTSFKRFQLHME
jgi:hypothetical protein